MKIRCHDCEFSFESAAHELLGHRLKASQAHEVSSPLEALAQNPYSESQRGVVSLFGGIDFSTCLYKH